MPEEAFHDLILRMLRFVSLYCSERGSGVWLEREKCIPCAWGDVVPSPASRDTATGCYHKAEQVRMHYRENYGAGRTSDT